VKIQRHSAIGKPGLQIEALLNKNVIGRNLKVQYIVFCLVIEHMFINVYDAVKVRQGFVVYVDLIMFLVLLAQAQPPRSILYRTCMSSKTWFR